jgi:glc operon protein GlcG
MKNRPAKTVRRSPARGVVLAMALGMVAPVGLARGQEPGFPTRRAVAAVVVEIRDRAGLFGADAIAGARRELERASRETGVSVVIETIDSLDGQPADRAAMELAERSGNRGIYILAARKEHKLEVLASREYRGILTDAHRRAIISAFSQPFSRQDFNEGLRRGAAAIVAMLDAVQPSRAGSPRPPVPEGRSGLATEEVAREFGARAAGDSPLVVRNQVRLTLEGARAILAGAEAKARAMGWKMNIAVVDDGGHLIAFERMEGARPASVYTALTKATTAATMRQPSGPFPPGTTTPDPLLNISLQNAAMASGGKVTTLYGGVPVVLDGQVIGAVGCGGGSGEQDAEVARAGIQSLTDQLEKAGGGGAAVRD